MVTLFLTSLPFELDHRASRFGESVTASSSAAGVLREYVPVTLWIVPLKPLTKIPQRRRLRF